MCVMVCLENVCILHIHMYHKLVILHHVKKLIALPFGTTSKFVIGSEKTILMAQN